MSIVSAAWWGGLSARGPAFQRTQPAGRPAAGKIACSTSAPPAEKLDIQFVLANFKFAKAALERVRQYAMGLEARITILAAQIVPYPLPLEEPPVRASLLQQRLSALAAEQSVEISVEVFLCRDRSEAFRRALKPRSVVIVAGAQRGWWPTEERRVARTLRRDGHLVICV